MVGRAAMGNPWLLRRIGMYLETGALLPGSYCLKLHALDPECVRLFDTVERGFSIRGASRELGLVRIAHRWHGGG